MRMQKREIFFFFFSYELGGKQEQREQKKKELGVKLVELGRRSAMGSLCTGSYRGAPPLSRPTPNFSLLFSMIQNDCHMVQKCMSDCRGRPMQA